MEGNVKSKSVKGQLKAIKIFIRLWLATNRKTHEEIAIAGGVHRNAVTLFLGDDNRDMRIGTLLGIMNGMSMGPAEFFQNVDALAKKMEKGDALTAFLKAD